METVTPVHGNQKDIKDLAGGALVNFAGKLGRSFRGAFLWVVTLLCGLEIQALYSLSWGLVSIVNRAAGFGLQRGVVRFVVEGRNSDREDRVEWSIAAALTVGSLSSALTVGLVLLSAEWVADFYGKPIAGAVRIMAWSAPFMTAASIFVAATRALRIMRFDVYVKSIAGPLILLVGGLAVGFAVPNLESIAWVQLAMALGICMLGAYYFQRCFSLENCLRRFGRRGLPWKRLGRFSLPVMLTDLIYGVLTQLDVLMLGWFVGKGQVYMIGIYVLARRIASVMLKAPQAFDPIFSSIVSELTYRNKQREIGHRFSVISRWILTINLPIFAGIVLVRDSLLNLVAGDRILTLSPTDIETGINILLLLGIGMMVQAMFAVVEPLLAMSGRPGLNLCNNVLWLASNFLLNIWLINIYGIVGAAVGATISMIMVSAVRILQVSLVYDIQPFHRSQFKPVVAALGGALTDWLIRDLVPGEGIWATITPPAAFLGIYFSLLGFLGLEAEDKVLLRQIYRQVKRIFSRKRPTT